MAVAKPFGCAHYLRKCKLVMPCCKATFGCRFCHDETQNHPVNRRLIQELICQVCDNRQNIFASCEKCGIRFGKYFCLRCRLFDDEDKGHFHCPKCDTCRVGGFENYFHCNKCNSCVTIQLQGVHDC